MEEKKYVGSGKASNEFFTNITVEVTSDNFKSAVYEYNGKKYVNLTVGKKREADQYGKTHYVCLNEYKPEDKAPSNKAEESNDLPF
jgi:hypothetical protein